MKGMLRRIPPFAPDYSGVNSVFYELGGITIINGADGCIGNVSGYDEPRYFTKKGFVFSSGLRNIHAISGDENILLQKIKAIPNIDTASCLVIMGTPTSAVIASDHVGIANLIEKELDIPVIVMNTMGIDSYDIGIKKAYLALAKRFVREYTGDRHGINIIGATPLDYWGEHQIDELTRALEDRGVNVLSCWGRNSGMDKVIHSARASVNLVISSSGISAAKYLKNKHGIPYLSAVPIGQSQTNELANKLIQMGGGCHTNKYGGDDTDCSFEITTPVCIVAEQLWANSFRRYLSNWFTEEDIMVSTFFEMDKNLKKDVDVKCKSEDELIALIKKNKPRTVIGDPMYKALVNVAQNMINKKTDDSYTCNYIEVPHLAVSSRLYWKHDKVYVGDNINI